MNETTTGIGIEEARIIKEARSIVGIAPSSPRRKFVAAMELWLRRGTTDQALVDSAMRKPDPMQELARLVSMEGGKLTWSR